MVEAEVKHAERVDALRAEFAVRRIFYTEYVHFGGSFGIRILEYVWNTVGIL